MITTALILAGSLFGRSAPPVIGQPVVAHVAVKVSGGCHTRGLARERLAYVEVLNTGNVAVGIGTRITFPDVIDDGTLSVIGLDGYAVYAPGNENRWAAQFRHIHLVVRYRGNELATDPETGIVYNTIEQLDEDIVCPAIPAP